MPLTTEPVSFALSLKSLSSERESALEILQTVARGLDVANCATVFYRFLMGKQLVIIQEHKLWQEEAGPQTWDGWINDQFPVLTRFSPSTAYGAMQLAKCEALSQLDEDALRSFRLLQNALRIARLERRGGAVTPQLVQSAITLSSEKFRLLTGDERAGSVEVRTNGNASAMWLTKIVNLLKQADVESLKGLAEQVELMFALAGGNPTDLADALRANIELELQNLQEQRRSAGSRRRSNG